nr:MAG TPA: hypothetical protein [Caudoviricetes sp.]
MFMYVNNESPVINFTGLFAFPSIIFSFFMIF